MSKIDKLLKNFLKQPIKKDLKYKDLEMILENFWYSKIKWSWSRVKFFNKKTKDLILLHKPHPWDILKVYQVKLIQNKIKNF